MPKFSAVNGTVNTNNPVMGHQLFLFGLKTAMIGAGWKVTMSSDGITFDPTGDRITSPNTGAGGLSNNYAWYVIEEPGPGRRQYCVQCWAAAAMQVRIKYSALAKFIGGSPSATRVPSATDERVLLGGGTDAAPTWQAIASTGANYHWHAVALSHAISGAYGFYMWLTNVAGNAQGYGMFFMEPMLPGTFSPSDQDPVIMHCDALSTASPCAGWMAFGTPGQLWASQILYQTIGNMGTYGTDLGDGGDINIRPWWVSNQAGAWRIKGCSAVLANRCIAGRAWPATMNRTTDASVYLDAWLWPWPENTEPTIA